tara:strand:- start:1352 stop:1795 length:444 start_codon:yes stop_codon:yes gene_type:complete
MMRMNNIWTIVPGVPKAQIRHRHTRSGHTYDPSAKDKKDFINKLKAYTNENVYPLDKPLTGHITLMITFKFPWPKKWYRTGKYAGLLKDNHPIVHTKKPDIDNLVKFVMDVGNGELWKDDCQIYRVQAKKIYSLTPETLIIIEATNE